MDARTLSAIRNATGGNVVIKEEKRVVDEAKRWNNRNLDQLGPLIPEADDPNVLFRRNWLARGQAFALVASAGVGKSSMADQMAFHWVVGRSFLADPIRPMKISVIQFEDSDRDLQEQRDGMIRGLRDEGYDDDLLASAMSGVHFPTDFTGLYGTEFTKRLREYQCDMNYDLIFINPLQRCFGEDVSDQAAVSQFCSRLDEIMKDKERGCAFGIVMHTPKFQSGKKDARQSVDDYAEYAMAGSQEWTAWIRAVINFQKHGASEEYFDVKASKRGKRLGWKDDEGNPITKRIFKHSDGFIYWQEVTDPDEIAAIPEEEVRGRGATKKDDLDIGASAHSIASNYRDEMCGLTKPAFAEHFWKKDGRVHRKADYFDVFDQLVSEADDFGLTVTEVKNLNGKKTIVLT